MAKILHQVGVGESKGDVYTALTTQEGMQAWWSQHSETQAEVGSVARISFYNNMVTFELKIEELVADEKVVWAVTGGPPDWMNTTITWNLAEENGMTMVNFSHEGFASMDGNFAGVNYNWGWYLTSLKFYLEKGEGMPHTDADIPG